MISLLSLWMCACSSDGPAPNPESPPGLPGVEAPTIAANWTAAEVADILAEQLGELPDIYAPGDIYLDLMAAGDENCPGDLYQILDDFLYGCDSTTGYHYAGVSEFITEEVPYDDGFATTYVLSGDFWIDTPEGDTLEVGGHNKVLFAETNWKAELKGSWTWTAGEPWLATGFSGIYSVAFHGEKGVFITGALDMVGVNFGLEEFALDAECGWGPVGGLRLRDASGGWYALEFDSCDPCTEVWFEGVSLGESCVDFEPMRTSFGVVVP